jgi:hypothetical protein
MSFETTGQGMMRRKAVWGGAVRAAIAVTVVAVSGCGDLVRQGTGSSYLIVTGFEAASGATPQAFGGTLQSDVVTVVDGSGSIFNDVGRIRFTLGMKDAGSADSPTTPTANNFITLNRYHVEFIRADGRNAEGVDVPFAFDGAITATVGAADTSVAFTLVRHQAKLEAPLAALARNPLIISTIARVTFYGRDQTGREVIANAQMSVDFGNFGDPSSGGGD